MADLHGYPLPHGAQLILIQLSTLSWDILFSFQMQEAVTDKVKHSLWRIDETGVLEICGISPEALILLLQNLKLIKAVLEFAVGVTVAFLRCFPQHIIISAQLLQGQAHVTGKVIMG